MSEGIEGPPKGSLKDSKNVPKRSLGTNRELKKNEKGNRADTRARTQFGVLNGILARVSVQSRKVVFRVFCGNRAETAARTQFRGVQCNLS